MRRLALRLSLPLLLLCCAASARADPISIVVTGGSITTGTPSNMTVSLSATNFSFHAQDAGPPRGSLCGPCTPGSAFPTSIRVRFVQDATTGLTYNGVLLAGGGTGGVLSDLTITLPPFTIPPDQSPVTVPFTLGGTLTTTPVSGSPVTFLLSGTGTVTFTFFPNATGGSVLGATSFNFAPAATPEPATLLLLGTGLTAAAGLVRRRGRRVRPDDAD